MAELVDALFREDSWHFPVCFVFGVESATNSDVPRHREVVEGGSYALQGIQTTQILHTNSEDCSTDSPVHAKVEEQSTFRVSLQNLLNTDSNIVYASACCLQANDEAKKVREDTQGIRHPASVHDHLVATEHRATNDTEDVAKRLDTVTHAALNLTFSNSSNSSNCAVPSASPQSPKLQLVWLSSSQTAVPCIPTLPPAGHSPVTTLEEHSCRLQDKRISISSWQEFLVMLSRGVFST